MKRSILFVFKHLDFIVVDFLALILGYYASVQVRYALNIPMNHPELFMEYGIVLILIYLIVSVISQGLSGIIKRSFAKETYAVLIQLVTSWSIYTVILYLVKEGHEFSRSIYLSAFFICYFFILAARTLWKMFIRYSIHNHKLLPKLLIVCDSDKTRIVIDRVQRGSFENAYIIVGVLTNENEGDDYRDSYPIYHGFGNLDNIMDKDNIMEAYVELSDVKEESDIIWRLLNHGVVVHRSLGDSRLDYIEQDLDTMSGRSVITIKSTDISIVTKAEELEDKLFRSWAKRNYDQ